MKNILVTGGCGFIGANFIRYLLLESDFTGRIINADKLTYAGNPENLTGIESDFPGRYEFVKADISDTEAMSGIFERCCIDTVCHFAAESHVDRSIVEPDAFVRTNIMGTFSLLELCRKYKDNILLFHHVSTDEVYGTLGSEGFFTEETPYSPSSPYSASKAGSDHLVRAYNKTYGIPVTVSNCSNNYGPYHFPEKLIPLMILNALEGKALPVYGDGRNVRDWLYVKDHCRAIWLIMKKGVRGETYNIGGRCEMPNIEVVRMICDLADEIKPEPSRGSRRELITFVKDRPGHDLRYAIDCSKLENTLGWHPDESFETGLRKTIQWYIDNPGWVSRVKSGEYQSWIERHYRVRIEK
ncbi:MAG: dTDP-glucose 4,6-dehydratase [Desulfobacteraceae bacterium IS3]|nr:MAG: dTDP-glucose 4,6-dehydratase [Desulfobacteraceae bacterium IS3]